LVPIVALPLPVEAFCWAFAGGAGLFALAVIWVLGFNRTPIALSCCAVLGKATGNAAKINAIAVIDICIILFISPSLFFNLF
jgi:hypothetical protein